jgi:hypothetical protein
LPEPHPSSYDIDDDVFSISTISGSRRYSFVSKTLSAAVNSDAVNSEAVNSEAVNSELWNQKQAQALQRAPRRAYRPFAEYILSLNDVPTIC